MTIVPTGYPDWSRRAARSDESIFQGWLGSAAPTKDTGIISVGGSSSIGVDILPQVGSARYQIYWWLDEAGTTYLTEHFIHVPAGTHFSGSIPCLGPFMQIYVDDTSALDYALVSVWTVWQPGPHGREVGDLRLAAFTNTPIAAGASASQTSAKVAPGMATLTIRSSVASFVVTVIAWRYDGTSFNIAMVDGNGGQSQSHLVSLPANKITLVINNTSAGAGNFWAYLVGATYGYIT